MSDIPEDVLSVKKQILADPEEPLNSIIEQLTEKKLEILKMWKSLESRKIGEDSHWVWGFLRSVEYAMDLPKFHNMSKRERRKLSEKLEKYSKSLCTLLMTNTLDGHLIYSDGKIFNGFYIYENFGEANKARIDLDGTKKLNITSFLEWYVKDCQKRIEDEPLPGKSGKNAPAIRFIRTLVDRNILLYKKPLNGVLATAANAIYETSYDESDIAKILNR